jgi:hypothetical protein
VAPLGIGMNVEIIAEGQVRAGKSGGWCSQHNQPRILALSLVSWVTLDK